jgi:two-component system, chemotaxis family, chemotaxis protein CheY
MSADSTILVVDDDPAIREVLEEALSIAGYSVETAANGSEAFERLDEEDLPRLILLDLMMPVMNGWRFCERQSADPRLSGIPVVIVSADRRATQAASILGAADCLTKPVGLDELLEVVARHVGRAGESLSSSAPP